MRVVAPALCAVLLIGAASGCAADETSALPETAEAEAEAFETSLEELSGVDDAVLVGSQGGAQLHLTVNLSSDATTEDVEEAAVHANGLRDADLPAGVYPGHIEMQLDNSIYAHFTLSNDDALRAQAGYWAELTRAGAESVSLRTFTQSLDSMGSPSPVPSSSDAPVLMNSPTGRYVGITVGDGDADEAAATIEAIRAIPDPGATVGEWHIMTEDGRVKAEFAQPGLPGGGDIATATALFTSLDDLGESSTLSLRINRSDDRPVISAELTAFDDAIEEADKTTVEDELRDTEIWPSVVVLVTTLDTIGTDFNVSLLSNALDDVGNFEFAVSVEDCEFNGDESWPALSDDLGEEWAESHQAQHQTACAA